MSELRATLLDDDQQFQLILTAGEMSVASLALTMFHGYLANGAAYGQQTLLEGLMHMIAYGISPQDIARHSDSIQEKLDRLADHISENSRG